MQLKNFFITMSDGFEIACNRWIPDEDVEIKGVIQLHHGLCEHSLRYDRFGSVLAENGYVLNAYDMRGHGKTAQNAESKGTGLFGKLADKDGFLRVTDDLHEIIDSLKKDYPGKKVILMGHSFGSFVSQCLLERFENEVDLCILSGTSGPMAITGIGKIVAKLVKTFKGGDKPSPFLKKLSFGSYNKRIQNPESPNSWTSSDKTAVMLYDSDAWCQISLKTSFYYDMTWGLSYIHKKANMKKVPQNLPILFIYGSEDPVSNYGKTIKNLIKIYIDNGVQDIEEICYEGDRHEPLNEVNREEVEQDILEWIAKKL
ncbi:MAG: lysophospholipase [Treponema sp.]|nr:lysophospholipase [Treponema sp.]